MARPVVLVYQDYQTPSVTPATPDLNCIAVGPAYWIKDYLDDKGDIGVSTPYGTQNATNPYVPPVALTDAVTVSEPPANKTGALLDASSVHVYFDECRVHITEDADDTDDSTGATVEENSNVVTATGTTPIDFETEGVQAGDYLIIENPAGGTQLVKRVLAVDSAHVLRATTNFVAANTGLLFRIEREVSDVLIDSAYVRVTGNETTVLGGVTTTLTGETTPRTVNYGKVYIEYRSLRQDLRRVDTVSSETDIQTKVGKIDARNPLASVLFTGLQNTLTPLQCFGIKSDNLSGHTECMDIIEGRKDIYAIVPITEDRSILAAYKTHVDGLASVTYAETNGIPQKFRVVLGAQTLPLTSVLSGPFDDGSHYCVSGAVTGTPIVSADLRNVFVDEDATAAFVTSGVRAGDTLVIVSDTASPSRVGSYTVAEVYDDHRLRVTDATPFAAPGSDPTGKGSLSGSVQYYIIRESGSPVTGTSFTGGTTTASTNKVTGGTAGGAAVKATGVLTLTVYPNDAETVTIGTTTYTFRAIMPVPPGPGDVALGINIGEAQANLTAAIDATHPLVNAIVDADPPPDMYPILISAKTAGAAGNTIATTETLANGSFDAATLEGGADGGTGTGVTGSSAHVGKILRITDSSEAADERDWLITALAAVGPPAEWTVAPISTIQDGTSVVGALYSPIVAVTSARAIVTRRPFRKLVSATGDATFNTSMVIAGDTLQIPAPVTAPTPGFTPDYTTVAPYSYTVAYIPNENVLILEANTDVVADDMAAGDTALYYRVLRNLTKDDQIDTLVTIAQSFNSRRVVLMWPDLVDVAGLTDGSKTRTVLSEPALADAQPGYYLAITVGAMTAGLPSHQGFTNLGIAGIDRIYHSTSYFSDRQLTELSDSGWFVFAQETPEALPFCIHQLTTDADTLETGEYSLVKNFDFIALFFLDIMDDFIGPYNVTDETLSFLRTALITGIDILKLRKYAKIGAPLTDATLTSLYTHPTLADRVECYMSVSMPKPLNRIGLHLISA